MINIKLLAIDLDGTCLNSEIKITNKTKEKLKEVLSQDILIVPNTGRSISILPEDIYDIDNFDYYITSNGSAILNKEREIIFQKALDKNQIEQILNLLKDYDVFYEFYINEQNYISNKDYDRLTTFVDKGYHDLYESSILHIPEENLKEKLLSEPVQKIEFRLHSKHTDKCKDIFTKINEIPNISIIRQFDRAYEISHSDANKGVALEYLANKLNISSEEIMAIGDTENDRPMLEFAGIGVAMGQASKDVKEVADFVTDTNDNEGVIKAIDKIILEN